MLLIFNTIIKTSKFCNSVILLNNNSIYRSLSHIIHHSFSTTSNKEQSFKSYSHNKIDSNILSSDVMSSINKILYTSSHTQSIQIIKQMKQTLMNQVINLGSQLPNFHPINGQLDHHVDWGKQPMQRILHLASIIRPLDFWTVVASKFKWFKSYTKILDENAYPMPRWFVGGQLNVTYNCVDYHVLRGKGDKPAIYYDSPLSNSKKSVTYQELLNQVEALARGLKSLGVGFGDSVMIYLPVIPEAAISFLACARIGAIHSAVFGGFGLGELHRRIDMLKPKAVIVASCGIEPSRFVPYHETLYNAMKVSKHQPARIIVLQRPQLTAELQGNDVNWDELVNEHSSSKPVKPFNITDTINNDSVLIPVPSTHPLYTLYTSGTTADPKGVIRDHVGKLCSIQFSVPSVFDVGQGDVFLNTGDIGWILGHYLGVYGPLAVGATTIFFEGKPIGPPDAGVLFRIAEEYKAKGMFTTPSALRGIRRSDPEGDAIGKHKSTSLKYIWCGGERFDQTVGDWISNQLKKDSNDYPVVVDSWWQTETGSPMVSIMDGIPDDPKIKLVSKIGFTGGLIPGWNIHIIPEHQTIDTISGPIVVKLPLPPGAIVTLNDGDLQCHETYLNDFPGYFDTKDSGTWYADENRLRIDRRRDEVINVAAHRLSLAAMEQSILSHPLIAETAVVAVTDLIKGQVPLAFVVVHEFPKDTNKIRAQLFRECVQQLTIDVGPVACLSNLIILERLPRTHSSKVLRHLLVALVESTSIDHHRIPLNRNEDPKIFEKTAAAIKAQMYPPSS